MATGSNYLLFLILAEDAVSSVASPHGRCGFDGGRFYNIYDEVEPTGTMVQAQRDDSIQTL